MAPSQYLHYRYESSEPVCAHSYLEGAVLNALKASQITRTVLDAGCGNGSLTTSLARAGYQVAGFDLSESGIAQAQKASPNIEFRLASVYDDLRKYYGQPFDAVVSLEVIEHLYDPRLFLRRIHEVLKPGGVLVISTPYHGYWKNLSMALAGKLDHHFTALWDGGHIKFWSRRTISSILQESGFSVRSFHGVGRLPWLWKSMVLVASREPDKNPLPRAAGDPRESSAAGPGHGRE